MGTGSVRPELSTNDIRTPASCATGKGEDAEPLVSSNVSTLNTLPGATVPRLKLAPLSIPLGRITGGPKSNATGSARFPALSATFQQIRAGNSLVLTICGIDS